ncbi:hypothetical protein [Noviherbaspirillum cavernae]|uniref:hypothetical protein n=1 Tax=Noviherbaspirillum cavernae TaxID=2320862 RepID=UPI0011C37D6B|nr:hypothetical protein [Noviherbaspirillum cavernae]
MPETHCHHCVQEFCKHALAESRRAAPALRRISSCRAPNSSSGNVCSKPPFNEQLILPDHLHANYREVSNLGDSIAIAFPPLQGEG